MQRVTTIRIVWNEGVERDYAHRLSRALAMKISEKAPVAEARVIVALENVPSGSPGPRVARVATRRKIYETWETGICPVCELEMPVDPRLDRIVSHYPLHDEHRYDGGPEFFCRGSSEPPKERRSSA